MRGFNVGSLMRKAQGSQEHHSVEEPLHFAGKGEPALTGTVQFEVSLLKLPHEISVQVKNFHAAAESACSRCLKQFLYQIKIPYAEREFIIDLDPQSIEAGEDVEFIDTKTNLLVLDEMIRQEILLHSPAIPICSESCKGLCDHCGINRNQASCDCIQKFSTQNSPFKFL